MQQVESQENDTKQRRPYRAPLVEDEHNGSDVLTQKEAEEIFAQAVAELDTQPLLKKRERVTIGDLLELSFDLGVILFFLLGSIYLAITCPHTLIILYTKAIPASITATLDVPTRTLAPVTITRSATAPTTGKGHQDARAATGFVIFYNGLSIVQNVPSGTVFTGRDGERIRTDQTVSIPPNAPPEDGYVTVTAHALTPGVKGNIAADDVALALSSSLTVKNLSAFTGGRDTRTFRAVAAKDLQTLTSTLNETVAQAFPTAFPLQPGEAAIPTYCMSKTTPTHQIGEEAQSVTLTTSKTCSAVAYNQRERTRAASAVFTQTQPGKQYHVIGSIETTFQSVSPLTVTIIGKWAYTFTPAYEQLLAQHIQGDSPAKAQAYLLNTGVISYASVPNTLASADYINFLVLVG